MTLYTRLPVFTDLAIRDRLRDCRNLQQSMAICHILPCSAIFCLLVFTIVSAISATSVTSAGFLLNLLDSVGFCQDYNLKPILPYIYINWAIKLIIYTLFSHFFISFSYVMFWFYHTVYIYSLIIFTLLYIIATYTYFVILYCVNYLYYYIKCKTNLKPL